MTYIPRTVRIKENYPSRTYDIETCEISCIDLRQLLIKRKGLPDIRMIKIVNTNTLQPLNDNDIIPDRVLVIQVPITCHQHLRV